MSSFLIKNLLFNLQTLFKIIVYLSVIKTSYINALTILVSSKLGILSTTIYLQMFSTELLSHGASNASQCGNKVSKNVSVNKSTVS